MSASALSVEKRVTSQNDLMRHMKEKHGGKSCKRFQDNKCSFGTRCMFSHETVPARSVERSQNRTETIITQNQTHDFREFPQIGGQRNLAVTREVVTNMSQIMTQMMSQLNIVMNKMGPGPN